MRPASVAVAWVRRARCKALPARPLGGHRRHAGLAAAGRALPRGGRTQTRRFPPSCCRVWGRRRDARAITSGRQNLSHETSTFREYLRFPRPRGKKCACSLHWTFSGPTSASFRTQRGPTRRRPLLTHPLLEVSTTCVSDRGRAPASSDIL